jgi:SAM-dependent methyltransferase
VSVDIWKFYDITHRQHEICNPTSDEKLQRLVELLRLPQGAPVVDIACGKAAFLIRLAEIYDVRGVGVDISPFCIADAQKRLEERAPNASISFRQMDGADFRLERPHSLALASCIGASWVYKGHGRTLGALSELVEAGGWVVVGEPYWKHEPSEEYLQASGDTRDSFGTHAGNAEAGDDYGLELLHTFASSDDDWDRYEGLQWYAAAEYARSHPDDPDTPELTSRVARQRSAYLRWGRDTLGWAIYVFRRRSHRKEGT